MSDVGAKLAEGVTFREVAGALGLGVSIGDQRARQISRTSRVKHRRSLHFRTSPNAIEFITKVFTAVICSAFPSATSRTSRHDATAEEQRVCGLEWSGRRHGIDTSEGYKGEPQCRGMQRLRLCRIFDAEEFQDLSLPKSMIARLAKGVLPANTQIHKDALLALHKSATVFVSYIASKYVYASAFNIITWSGRSPKYLARSSSLLPLLKTNVITARMKAHSLAARRQYHHKM